jgi:hypothetical protein
MKTQNQKIGFAPLPDRGYNLISPYLYLFQHSLMHLFRNRKILTIAVVILLVITAFTVTTSHKEIDYSTQVKPIFNKKCISLSWRSAATIQLQPFIPRMGFKEMQIGKICHYPG